MERIHHAQFLFSAMPTDPKLYALAFAAHPDDVEITCGGTMLLLHRQGFATGVCDLTEGEMGTRGSRELRRKEAAAAAKVMGYTVRENLKIPDTNVAPTRANLLKVISVIRAYRPDIVFLNPPLDRHPDHQHTSQLVSEACFYAGLRKLVTKRHGKVQEPHRPKHKLYYIQNTFLTPDIIVDVSDVFEESRKGIHAFGSQFHNDNVKPSEPETHISRRNFLTSLDARAKLFGELIGVGYGEGFLYKDILGVKNLADVFK
jgi:bacillithiol biosynthesis deacetylase BshB1